MLALIDDGRIVDNADEVVGLDECVSLVAGLSRAEEERALAAERAAEEAREARREVTADVAEFVMGRAKALGVVVELPSRRWAAGRYRVDSAVDDIDWSAVAEDLREKLRHVPSRVGRAIAADQRRAAEVRAKQHLERALRLLRQEVPRG